MISTSLRSSSRRTELYWTGRGDGDVGPGAGADGEGRRRALHAGTWAWLRQVHGADVHVVRAPGAVQGAPGDALVTGVAGVALAVFTADCAPVALASPEGVVGLVHAGWRGLDAGVIEAAAEAMRGLGASRLEAALGPCIRAECYEFGPAELDRLAGRWGPSVRGRTAAGRPALDLPAAVSVALQRSGAELVVDAAACTACSDEWFSYRGRGDLARQATLLVAA
jgi:YfiH family protein